MPLAPKKPLTAADRSRARARKFGKAHPRRQAPQKVAFTLLDAMAPLVTIVGSPHETDVYVPGGKEPLCKLPPGERAVFACSVSDKTDDAGKVVGKLYAWSRVVEKKPDPKEEPKPAPKADAPAAPAAPSPSPAKAP